MTINAKGHARVGPPYVRRMLNSSGSTDGADYTLLAGDCLPRWAIWRTIPYS
jgi:hypothetical protein